MLYLRNKTNKVHVGNITIGGQNKVVIQSMTNTKTSNVSDTLSQIQQLVKNGCELVRVAIFDESDLKGLKEICSKVDCPIVADIHYNYLYAIKAIKLGAKKIRINPGNISNKKQLIQIINIANEYKAAIRIGINTGSLQKNVKPTVSNIIKCAKEWIKFFENNNFTNLVISLKSSNAFLTKDLYLKAASQIKYPLHLGVTEAGSIIDATMKSTIGLYSLLKQGIGDTIRISISGSPLDEPIVAKKLLSIAGIKQNLTNVVACPTCGRCQYNLVELLNKIETYVNTNPKELTIAIMGCSVNGIGECKHANIGVYGVAKNKVMLIKDCKDFGVFSTNEALKQFINIYNNY